MISVIDFALGFRVCLFFDVRFVFVCFFRFDRRRKSASVRTRRKEALFGEKHDTVDLHGAVFDIYYCLSPLARSLSLARARGISAFTQKA